MVMTAYRSLHTVYFFTMPPAPDSDRAALLAEIASLREQLAAARADAEQARQTTRQFISNMSHEIRTPMNGVLGMLELAMSTDLSPAQREYSQTAMASAESLLGMINDILDFSQIDAGHLRLRTGVFDLRERLGDVIDTIGVRARQKGLAMTLDVDDAVPHRVRGDLARLRQVLVNLVGNAIKFTEKGSVSLRVRRSEDASKIEFAVTDTGIGIPEQQREQIFEAFRQGDSSDTRAFGGAGLGLTISSGLVERMGGRIWLESEPGRGSTFYFTARLEPVEDANADDEARDIRAASGEPALSPQGTTAMTGPIRVLLAEDNTVNQKLMQSLLGREGHSVELAVNGQEAVDMASQKDFDVVLMDVQMPILGGIDATRRIREWESKVGGHVPIIALTARGTNGGRDDCLAAGMDGYLDKPVRSEDLLAMIGDLVARKLISRTAPPDRSEMPDEVFDLAELLRTVSDDRALVNELGAMFLDDAPNQVDAMRAAIANGDYAALKFAAHAIKGSAATLTARRVAKHARTLEVLAGEGRSMSEAAQHLADLETALGELRVRLDSVSKG
jgi:signal transduction histidine kinase/DNA-binding response OmpR family regulator